MTKTKKTLILDLFVDNNSTSTLGDIENTASFAMVHLVWHSFVDGTIYLNNKKKMNLIFKMYSKNHTQQFFSWMHFKADVHDHGKTHITSTIYMYYITHGSTSLVGRALGCREGRHRFDSQAPDQCSGS